MKAIQSRFGKINPLPHLRAWLQALGWRKAALPEQPVPVDNDPPPVPQGKKILVADDDVVILKTTAMKLQRHGYAVITANEPAEALRAAREEQPDLILLDVVFPPEVSFGGCVSWNGFQIMSWLHRLQWSRSTPVILMSGADLARSKDRSLGNDAHALFRKPLDHEDLLAAIKRTVDKTAPLKTGSQLEFQVDSTGAKSSYIASEASPREGTRPTRPFRPDPLIGPAQE